MKLGSNWLTAISNITAPSFPRLRELRWVGLSGGVAAFYKSCLTNIVIKVFASVFSDVQSWMDSRPNRLLNFYKNRTTLFDTKYHKFDWLKSGQLGKLLANRIECARFLDMNFDSMSFSDHVQISCISYTWYYSWIRSYRPQTVLISLTNALISRLFHYCNSLSIYITKLGLNKLLMVQYYVTRAITKTLKCLYIALVKLTIHWAKNPILRNP